MPTPAERFAAKVNHDGPVPADRPDAGPCHLWTASCFRDGYGQFKVTSGGVQRNVRAHRWAWEQVHGPLSPTVPLDHWACSTPVCVNPAHLRPVTTRENVLRSDTSLAAQNAAKTVCPQGHPYDAANTMLSATGSRRCRTCVRKVVARTAAARTARYAAQGLTARGTPPRR